MTNREKYITKRDEYDTMMEIGKVTEYCPIYAVVGDDIPYEMRKRLAEKGCSEYSEAECSECIQKWLNQEADQPKPQWQDAMMKNFLRKE